MPAPAAPCNSLHAKRMNPSAHQRQRSACCHAMPAPTPTPSLAAAVSARCTSGWPRPRPRPGPAPASAGTLGAHRHPRTGTWALLTHAAESSTDAPSRATLPSTSGTLGGAATAAVLRHPTIYQGSATAQGAGKSESQDRLLISPPPPGAVPGSKPLPLGAAPGPGPSLVLSAVFDGHGGSDTVRHISKRLPELLQANSDLLQILDQVSELATTDHCSPSSTSSTSSTSTSSDVESMSSQRLLQQCWAALFQRLDAEVLERSAAAGRVDGTTVTAGVHLRSTLFIAHAGDSRAVLSRGCDSMRLTRDHTPNIKTERLRIQAQGGRVMNVRGTWRIMLPYDEGRRVKMCATSRSLGDLDFKRARLMSCEPELSCVVLQPGDDAFSIFATDGLWCAVEDESAVQEVHTVLREYAAMTLPSKRQAAAQAAAHRLVDLAKAQGSSDDISVVVNLYEWEGLRAAPLDCRFDSTTEDQGV